MFDLLSLYPKHVLFSPYNIVAHTHVYGLHALYECTYPRMNPSTAIGLGRSFHSTARIFHGIEQWPAVFPIRIVKTADIMPPEARLLRLVFSGMLQSPINLRLGSITSIPIWPYGLWGMKRVRICAGTSLNPLDFKWISGLKI